jgi:hypothetical protein
MGSGEKAVVGEIRQVGQRMVAAPNGRAAKRPLLGLIIATFVTQYSVQMVGILYLGTGLCIKIWMVCFMLQNVPQWAQKKMAFPPHSTAKILSEQLPRRLSGLILPATVTAESVLFPKKILIYPSPLNAESNLSSVIRLHHGNNGAG